MANGCFYLGCLAPAFHRSLMQMNAMFKYQPQTVSREEYMPWHLELGVLGIVREEERTCLHALSRLSSPTSLLPNQRRDRLTYGLSWGPPRERHSEGEIVFVYALMTFATGLLALQSLSCTGDSLANDAAYSPPSLVCDSDNVCNKDDLRVLKWQAGQSA